MSLSRIGFLVVLCASCAAAHDMVQQGQAGPYDLTVYINPHARVQGFVEVVVRADGTIPDRVMVSIVDIDQTRVEHEEVAGLEDGLFRSSLPAPLKAQWRVLVQAEGSAGEGRYSIPVAAAAPFAGVALWAGRAFRLIVWMALSVALFFGLRAVRRSGRRLLPVSAAVASPLLFVGSTGEFAERVFYNPAVYSRLYQPAQISADVDGERLQIALSSPGLIRFRRFDDLVPDHGHPMHMYALRIPELDRVYHLHPEMVGPGSFEKQLPTVSAGRYFTIADIVHDNGLWEAPQGRLDLPVAVYGGPYQGDDSGGAGHPISQARFDADSFEFEDGLKMVWRRPTELRPDEPLRLRFELQDGEGRVVPDAELYMGMMGHAAIVRHDLEVFSHVHPTGSISMASLDALNGDAESGMMCHMPSSENKHAAEVTFPYAFPQPGRYRLIIQIKRAGQVKTAFFDAIVGLGLRQGAEALASRGDLTID